MRQVTRKGLISVAAAGGVLALGGGYAQADSAADGTASNSPGVLSGNNVQVPVHVPVNVCGNTVDVVGVLNPAMGNSCANASDGGRGSHGGKDRPEGNGSQGGHGGHGGGSHAGGGAADSPGVGSGNNIQVPIDIPVNVCGNSVDIVGVLNPAFGNECANDADTPAPPPEKPEEPVTPEPPTDRVVPPTPNKPETQAVGSGAPEGTEVLAQTGAGGLGLVIPAGAALLLAGGVIYRRTRAAA
ncbi:chaplin [Streptomyces sp. NBC_00838]|uniref:chaplin n=1 Tax=Streptomyces sp. NBC_00838 TaxID=2903680 RepID=UPI003862E2C0|nr:chaplin [Streptomyces sp. NBC_00838]